MVPFFWETNFVPVRLNSVLVIDTSQVMFLIGLTLDNLKFRIPPLEIQQLLSAVFTAFIPAPPLLPPIKSTQVSFQTLVVGFSGHLESGSFF